MHTHITLLSDFSYALGLIGLAEYEERQEVALWLAGSTNHQSDPRVRNDEEIERSDQRRAEEDVTNISVGSRLGVNGGGASAPEEDVNGWTRFLFNNRWMFTLGDVDCYPSVPHGHLNSKTREWPKLNPYTGRVFASVHQEKVAERLTIAEMKTLWNDDKFIELCRKQIHWYTDFSERYDFPNARYGRHVLPRWR